ncbi:MAG: NAD(+) kinase [Nevskiales bacterium]|nr:NAD(+) kinase [Nevskiales bacterium]
MSEFETVGLFGKPHDARVISTLRTISRYLQKRQCTVLIDRALAPVLKNAGERVAISTGLARRCDLAVVVGGDGTLLAAARTLAPAGVPILGINRGRLGFMVDVAAADARAALDDVFEGRYVRERRLLLSAEIHRGRKRRGSFLAINDVVIRSQAAVRMLEFETWLDDEFISQHRADGIIISTPTGSTAYALSSGGPVLHPGLEALTLVPICPHALSDRPVVVGCDRSVRVVLGGAQRVRAMCTSDGQRNETLSPGDGVVVTRSEHVLELIHPENYSYFNILRNKLHWGRERFYSHD